MATFIEGCPSYPTNPEFVGDEHIFENIRPLRSADLHRAGIFNAAILVSPAVGMGDHRPSLPHGHVAQQGYHSLH